MQVFQCWNVDKRRVDGQLFMAIFPCPDGTEHFLAGFVDELCDVFAFEQLVDKRFVVGRKGLVEGVGHPPHKVCAVEFALWRPEFFGRLEKYGTFDQFRWQEAAKNLLGICGDRGDEKLHLVLKRLVLQVGIHPDDLFPFLRQAGGGGTSAVADDTQVLVLPSLRGIGPEGFEAGYTAGDDLVVLCLFAPLL